MSSIPFAEFLPKSNEVLNFLREELKKIRSGRANPSLVEDIAIEAYGAKQPIKNVANITVADATLITIQPWDKSLVGAIVKAIQESNLGINPVNSADVIRLPIPALNTERRVELVKIVKEQIEKSRISIRNLRKEVILHITHLKKEAQIGEDEFNRMEKDLQKQIDEVNEQIEQIGNKKEEEIMKL